MCCYFHDKQQIDYLLYFSELITNLYVTQSNRPQQHLTSIDLPIELITHIHQKSRSFHT